MSLEHAAGVRVAEVFAALCRDHPRVHTDPLDSGLWPARRAGQWRARAVPLLRAIRPGQSLVVSGPTGGPNARRVEC
jgi:hypothetical protein